MKLWESRKKNQEGEELKELFQKETLQEEERSEEPPLQVPPAFMA